MTPRRCAQTPDSKKEEFRKYLEKSGVIDALTKGEYALQTLAVALAASCALRELTPTARVHFARRTRAHDL